MNDERYDVIVVGTGGGLFGAYAAGSRGLRTLVIEKAEWVGGTTAYSGAGIWLPGNAAEVRGGIEGGPEAARPYLDAIIGDTAPVALREAYLRGGPPLIDELERDPIFGQFEWRGVPDYFPEAPGYLPQGRTIFPRDIERSSLGELEPLVRRPIWTERWNVEPGEVMTGGQALIGRALKAAMATGNVTLLTNTALDRLILEDDAVVGVEAIRDGERVEYVANFGVLLAAGGYEASRALREKYQSPITDEWTMGASSNTGDALLAGMEIGAGTALLDDAWFAPGVVAPDGRPVFYTMVWSGIWVNQAGERFMNERLPYDRAGHEILEAHRRTGVSHLPTYWVFDQRQIDNNAFDFLPVDPPVPGWFDVDTWLDAGALVRADTLEGLAVEIGVPADALVATVEEFNGFARSGVDEHYHRGECAWDRITARLFGKHEDGPNRCLGVIDEPPYYAVEVVATDLGTKGGLTTDEHARVLRPDGSVIEGLYASGNTMASALGRIYPGAGGPIGATMVFSYIAALDMAERRATTTRTNTEV